MTVTDGAQDASIAPRSEGITAMRFNTTITQPSGTATSAATHIFTLPLVREVPLPKVDAGAAIRTW